MKNKLVLSIYGTLALSHGFLALAQDSYSKSENQYQIAGGTASSPSPSGYMWEIRESNDKIFLAVSIGGSNPDPAGTQGICGQLPQQNENLACGVAYSLPDYKKATFSEQEFNQAERRVLLEVQGTGQQAVVAGDSIPNDVFDQIVDWSYNQQVSPTMWGWLLRRKHRSDAAPPARPNTRSTVTITDPNGRVIGGIHPDAGYRTNIKVYSDHVAVFYKRADGSDGPTEVFQYPRSND